MLFVFIANHLRMFVLVKVIIFLSERKTGLVLV